MEYIKVGLIVNTHALKGEVKVKSSFEFKDKIFIPGNKVYIGFNKILEEIETHRIHKDFDLIKFKNINYINDVLKYKGDALYINKEDIKLDDDEVLYDEIINMNVYSNNKLIGKVEDYIINGPNTLIVCNNKYIPYQKELIEKIDKSSNSIYFNDIDYLMR